MTAPQTNNAAARLAHYLHGLIKAGRAPLFVGVDGRSGSGKSTLAAGVRDELGTRSEGSIEVTVIDGDGFYAGGSAASWDSRSPQRKADTVIDWRRQQVVLAELRQRGVARWREFDWEAEDWDQEPAPLAETPSVARLAPVVLLDGAYSCRPELHDYLDVRVLLVVPTEIRHRQLLQREGAAYRDDWVSRWSGAEDYYFGSVMTPDRFDLVLD